MIQIMVSKWKQRTFLSKESSAFRWKMDLVKMKGQLESKNVNHKDEKDRFVWDDNQ